MSRRKTFSLISLLFLGTSCVPGTGPAAVAQRTPDPRPGVNADAKVMASPDVTYRALRAMREEDPSGCRVLSSAEQETVVEEVFDGLPVIGKATCVYRETYEPVKKVSFKMISSDKLKAFEGEWNLQPIDNGQHTFVSLRSYIDTGLKIPFCKQITAAASANEVKQQVADLKKSAELKQKQLACKSKSQTL